MRWEYKVVDLPTEGSLTVPMTQNQQDTLDEEGSREWELVSVVPVCGDLLAYFKRERPT